MFQSPAEKERKKGKPYRLAIVLAIIAFLVVAPEVQEGNSMDPAIKDGDVCVASKFASYSAKRKAPEPGTPVVLNKKYSLDAGADDNMVSRVRAVPGDTVEISKGKVLVNGEEYVPKGGSKGTAGSFPKTKLTGNEVFLLNDNSASGNAGNPDSSNPELGLVDMREIRGNIIFRIWPLTGFGTMTKN